MNPLVEHGTAVLDQPLGEIMTREVFTCSRDDSVGSIMAAMTDRRIRHIPVVDANGRLCGIVSIGDVVKRHLRRGPARGGRDARVHRRLPGNAAAGPIVGVSAVAQAAPTMPRSAVTPLYGKLSDTHGWRAMLLAGSMAERPLAKRGTRTRQPRGASARERPSPLTVLGPGLVRCSRDQLTADR